MSKSIVTAFCEHETFSCLICNIITSISSQDCDYCKPEEGAVNIMGVDAKGNDINLKFNTETLTLTIKASKATIERHLPAIKKLLHYPELVSFTGRDVM